MVGVRRLAIAGLLGLLAAGAAAQTPEAADTSEKGERPFALRWRSLELHARLLAYGDSERNDQGSERDLGVDNLRLELRWRPRRWFRGVFEWDHATVVEGRDWYVIKDAFVELRGGRFQLRAGQFKSPISPIEMESRWDVPSAERGLLSDLLTYSFGVAGRRPGLELGWDQKGDGLSATAAVQRATSTRGERIGDESFDNVAKDWSALTTTARLAWRTKQLEVGAAFDLRPAEPLAGEGYQQFWTAGVDLSWRVKRRSGPRLWAEGYAGSSWQDANAFDGRAATFIAARLLAAWSLFLSERRSVYVEPFAMGALVEPDTRVTDDLVWEASGGLHFGGYRHLRLVLEAQHRRLSRNAPASLGLTPAGSEPTASRTRFVAQIGTAF